MASGVSFAAWQLKGGYRVDYFFFLTITPIALFYLSFETRLPCSTEKLVAALGNMTYSSYLLHFPIQLLASLGLGMAGLPIPLYDTWFLLAFVATTMLASHLTFVRFEAPAQTWLRSRLLQPARRRVSLAKLGPVVAMANSLVDLPKPIDPAAAG